MSLTETNVPENIVTSYITFLYLGQFTSLIQAFRDITRTIVNNP